MDVFICEQMQPLSSSSTKQDKVFSLTCPPCELLAHSCPLSVSPFKVERRDHYLWNELNARKESSAGWKGKNGDRCSSSLFFILSAITEHLTAGLLERESEKKWSWGENFSNVEKKKKYSTTHWLEHSLYEVFFNSCKYRTNMDKVTPLRVVPNNTP